MVTRYLITLELIGVDGTKSKDSTTRECGVYGVYGTQNSRGRVSAPWLGLGPPERSSELVLATYHGSRCHAPRIQKTRAAGRSVPIHDASVGRLNLWNVLTCNKRPLQASVNL